jgi:purine-binding chemotaxis protein CheW
MSMPGTMPTADASSAAAPTPEVLSLRVGAEAYGIDVGCVPEVRAWERPTRLAHAPACVLGVINLRGAIVPIVDPRPLLGNDVAPVAAPREPTPVGVMPGIGRRTLGLVFDVVSDVLPPAGPPTTTPSAASIPFRALAPLGKRLRPPLDGEARLAALDAGAFGRA